MPGPEKEASISSLYRLGEDVLFSIFGANPVEIGSNTPVPLDDPGMLLLVHKGDVDIFAVRLKDGRTASARAHLVRIKEGSAAFGLDLSHFRGKLMLLAVGTSQTSVSQVERARFEEALANPMLAKHAVKLLDGWIRNFSSSIVPDTSVRQVVPLEAAGEIQLATGEIARPRREVVWAQIQTGMIEFVSRDELPLLTGGDFIPLCDKTWIRAHRDSRLTMQSTLGFMTAGFTWQHINRFHDVILNSILWNLDTREDQDRERLLLRQAQDSRRVDAALKGLADLLSYRRDEYARLQHEEVDALVAASQIVGQAIGATVLARPERVDGKKENQTLELIIRNSGLRMRQVTLREDWWRQDNGALLAFMEGDQRPVALVPDGTRAYRLHDPARKTVTPVTASVARELAPAAYQLYRTLPNQILSIRRLLRFGLRGTRRDLMRVLSAGILGGIIGMAVPLVIGRIFDLIVPSADRAGLAEFMLLLLVGALVTALFQVVQNIALLRLEMRLDTALQSALWDRLLNLPVPFFREYTAGDLSIRAMGISTIRRRISGSLAVSLLAGIFSLFNFALLFYLNAGLALLATALILVAFAVSALAGLRKMRYERQLADLDGYISGMVFQFINGISKFRVAGVESRAFTEWAKSFTQKKKVAFQAGSIENWLQVFNSTYPVIATMALFAAVTTIEGISTGQFLAFNAAFIQFLLAALTLSNTFIAVLEIVPAYERMKPILQTLPEVDETRTDPGELSGEIEVSRVSFRYEPGSPLILGDVSIHIKPGQFVAIVGPSGSGKSTLFRLLLGFEQPESGAIFYDGQDLANLDITSVRQQLGVVLQNGQLMTGDIFSNIVGVAPLTLEDAWRAAEMSGLKKDIEQMPMGMHTVISEGGSTLSGGQRQRLLIARAIARRPKILFFDEATSALDNQTQAVVSESLERLDATRIVIAHRLTTIVNADHILVMEKGRIVP
ncbi:MAG: NHLP bacteriocin export ABC transporter permease/ATPase subunit [Anaerolineae bacterium]|nr:NHLP bacteriocin export ABC transporter permease/ATPase subunit [Anaerolineae bacterium]